MYFLTPNLSLFLIRKTPSKDNYPSGRVQMHLFTRSATTPVVEDITLIIVSNGRPLNCYLSLSSLANCYMYIGKTWPQSRKLMHKVCTVISGQWAAVLYNTCSWWAALTLTNCKKAGSVLLWKSIPIQMSIKNIFHLLDLELPAERYSQFSLNGPYWPSETGT